jgi:hypothetical protein
MGVEGRAMSLGQAEKKGEVKRMYERTVKAVDALQNEINEYRPLSRNALKQLKEYYRIGLTYSSNALEGNSLTETETKIVLEEGITIGGKPLKDHLEALGHSEAYDHLHKLSKNRIITEQDVDRSFQRPCYPFLVDPEYQRNLRYRTSRSLTPCAKTKQAFGLQDRWQSEHIESSDEIIFRTQDQRNRLI